MHLSPTRFLTLLASLAAAVGVGVMLSARTTAKLRQSAEETSAERHVIDLLRGERDALAARQPTTAELEQLVRDQAALAAEHDALVELHAGFQRTTLEAMRRNNAETKPASMPPTRVTPEASMQSVVQAVTNGESDVLADLLDFDDQARIEADAFYASLPKDVQTQFASADRLIAQVMTAKTNLDQATVTVDASTLMGADDVALRMQLVRPNGPVRTATFHLHRATDGWRLRVPAKVIEGYRALVTGVVSPSADASPPSPNGMAR